MRQAKLTERQIILKCLNENTDVTCRKTNCDEPEKEGNTGKCCNKCSLEILNGYKNKIYNNAIKDFAKWIFEHINVYHFRSEKEMIEQFKNQSNTDKTSKTNHDKLSELSRLFEQTFDWGCNDEAKALYANAVYAIISNNPAFNDCEKEFIEHMRENHIS